VNTETLVDLLSANLEPANHHRPGKALTLSMVAGGVAALLLMLATIGLRSNFASTAHLEWIAIKLVFALAVVGTAASLLVREMHPGEEDRLKWALTFLPFLSAISIAFAMFMFVGREAWIAMLLGASPTSPARCLIRILLFGAIPLVILMWTLREGAPTRLKLCGATAGLVAGGLGAAAYAFSCTSDSIPFIAVWYSAAILLFAVVGAQLGPRLLRW
jgi:hypothetical protein